MNYLKAISLSAFIVCLLNAVTFQVQAAPDVSRQVPGSIVGSWTLVSEVAHQGQTTTEPLGTHPVGAIMFDGSGRFMLMIARSDIPKFAANKRDAGTAEENKAVLAGSLAFFGTYQFASVENVLTLHPESSTFPNWVGADQKRSCTVTVDEMLWTNRTPAIGAEFVELVWKRDP